MKKLLILLLFITTFSLSEKISEIQGKNIKSSFLNKKVTNVQGIVTYILENKYNKGFFIQSKVFDNDKNTSEGIYVEYDGIKNLKYGDLVSVNGIVGEIQFAKFDASRLTNTLIYADKVEILASNLKPIVTYIYGNEIPKNMTDNNLKKIERDKSVIDFFASLEGMVIKIVDPYITSSKEDYKDIQIIPKLARDNEILTENGGILYSNYGKERKNIFTVSVNDPIYLKNEEFAPNFTPNPGDKFEKDIVGVLTFDNFNSIKIFPTEKVSNIIDKGAKVDEPIYEYNEDMLNVVTYNIENHSHIINPQKTIDFAFQVKEKLNLADIINLVEMGDDDGDVLSSVVSSEKNGQEIIKAIKKLTGIEYGYISIDPKGLSDGGKPGIHIRNAILYRKDRLKVVNENFGTSLNDTYFKDGKLVYNPGKIGTKSDEFSYTRKPLIVNFDFNGKSIYIVSIHLSSKRGDESTFSLNPNPRRKSEKSRHKQAKYINDFVKEILNNEKDATVMVLGDINDYDFSKTTNIINGDILYDVMQELDTNKKYSYVYDGMGQVLDNIMINKEYKGKVNVDVLRINSEFTKSQGSISDHDPIFIQFKLK